MPRITDPLQLTAATTLKNRFALAPLTNQQSNDDGTASDADLRWFKQLAEGGFSLLTTCAANVQPNGRSFVNQLGIYDDRHLGGLARLAEIAHRHGALATVQLHHGGSYASRDLIGDLPLLAASDDETTGARAMTLEEVEELRDAFVAAAARAQRAGFDGIELHGAFGFVLTAFTSPANNRRSDRYGGSPEGRSLLLREILIGIREACGQDFLIGLRQSLSAQDPHTAEQRALVGALIQDELIDYLDLVVRSLDTTVEVGELSGEVLIDLFLDLPRGRTSIGVSGEVMSTAAVQRILDRGADLAFVGSGAVVHHDFPRRAIDDVLYEAPRPVTTQFLHAQGRSPAFVEYLTGFRDLVTTD